MKNDKHNFTIHIFIIHILKIITFKGINKKIIQVSHIF